VSDEWPKNAASPLAGEGAPSASSSATDSHTDSQTTAPRPGTRDAETLPLPGNETFDIPISTIGSEAGAEEGVGELVVAGQRVGNYRIDRRIGSGGMGHVYAATHLRLGRKVAIKILRSRYVFHREALGRFFAEARIASQINHPNIVAITDFLEGEGAPASYVMEYLEGETLWARLKRDEQLTVSASVDIAEQMARGLLALHEVGVVHRDVKPSNVFLVGENGPTIKLLDFGLIKEGAQPTKSDEEGPHPEKSRILGTPGYMPPEQMRSQDVDLRADIYAFGTVLYEMLCGHRPFITKDEEQLLAERLEGPKALTRTAGIPAQLEQLVSQCLQPNPDNRPQSIKDVLAALEAVKEALAPVPRRREAVWLVAIGAVVLLTAVAIFLLLREDKKLVVVPPKPIKKAPERPIASLKAWHNDVSRRRRNSEKWDKAALRMKLYHLDALKTGSRSRAKVAFVGGDIMKVAEQSEVLIELPRRDSKSKKPLSVVRLKKGQLRLDVKENRSVLLIGARGKTTRIDTKGKAVLRVTTDATGKTEIALTDGQARLAAGKQRRTLRKGQALDSTAGILGPPEPLPPYPSLSAPGIDEKLEPPKLVLRWQTIAAAARYRLQVATGSSFENIVIDRLLDKATFNKPDLPYGRYAWRVSSISSGGRESEFGFARRFVLQKPYLGALVNPADNEVLVVAKGRKRTLYFRWTTKAKKVLFVIARQATLDKQRVVVRRFRRQQQQAEVSGHKLRAGAYYWGVFVDGKRKAPLQEQARRFYVKHPEAPQINVKVKGWK
jgi:serine/threonine protein kinase